MLATKEKCLRIYTLIYDDYSDCIQPYFSSDSHEWRPVEVITKRKGTRLYVSDTFKKVVEPNKLRATISITTA